MKRYPDNLYHDDPGNVEINYSLNLKDHDSIIMMLIMGKKYFFVIESKIPFMAFAL